MEMNNREKAVRFHLFVDNGKSEKYLNEQEVQEHIKYLEACLKSMKANRDEMYKQYFDEFLRFQDACYAMRTMVNVTKEISDKYIEKIKVWENDKF